MLSVAVTFRLLSGCALHSDGTVCSQREGKKAQKQLTFQPHFCDLIQLPEGWTLSQADRFRMARPHTTPAAGPFLPLATMTDGKHTRRWTDSISAVSYESLKASGERRTQRGRMFTVQKQSGGLSQITRSRVYWPRWSGVQRSPNTLSHDGSTLWHHYALESEFNLYNL